MTYDPQEPEPSGPTWSAEESVLLRGPSFLRLLFFSSHFLFPPPDSPSRCFHHFHHSIISSCTSSPPAPPQHHASTGCCLPIVHFLFVLLLSFDWQLMTHSGHAENIQHFCLVTDRQTESYGERTDTSILSSHPTLILHLLCREGLLDLLLCPCQTSKVH